MDKETINKIKEHLGKPSEITIECDNEIIKLKISPLNVEHLPELYESLKILEGTDKDPSKLLQNLTKENLELIAKLGVESLKPNYPEVSEMDLKEIVLRNMFEFISKIWEMNIKMPKVPQQLLKNRLKKNEPNRNN